jgi:Peptidase family M28
MAAAGNRGLVLGLAGIALLLAATLAAYRPPAPLRANASPDVFSAYRAGQILQELVGNGLPRPVGSPAGARMRETIVRQLSALGYAPELQSGLVCRGGVCGTPVNIIATLRPSTENEDAVMLAAHYDSVPAGPGASDDGAGVATMLEIARILAARPRPPHPVVLLITDGEEAGLLGALLFVQQHPLAKQVKAAVNLEARGTSGPSLMFETGTANSWLMRLYGSAIARPFTNSLYYVVYKQLPNDTDFTVFKAAGIQGFNFAFIGNVGRYHTPLDNVANADASSIQHQGDNALAAVSALAHSPTLNSAVAESVFFDGFARTLIAWPAAFTLPAALVTFALLLAEIVILLRRRALTVREVLWGVVGTLCTLALAVALCVGILAMLLIVGKVPPLAAASWIAHPAPMHIAAAAFALFAAASVSAWLGRRAGFWGFWAAASLLGAILSLAGALVIPVASFALLLWAAAAGLGALPSAVSLMRSRARPWAAGFAALVPAMGVFAAIFPLLGFLYTALGSFAWPAATLLLSFGAVTLLPLLAAASHRARRQVTATAALFAAGCLVLTLSLPTYSAEWPERINLEYWLDADTGGSNYLVRCDSRLPAALAAAAPFDLARRPRFAGSGSLAFYAAAPQLALAAPELRLTAPPTAASAGATHYALHLRSLRGAPEMLMVFPASAKIAEATLETASGPVRTSLNRLRSGATVLDLVSLPAGGVDIGLDAAGRLPLAIQFFDQSYDFPGDGTLQRARQPNAISSQDGDLTVVHRTATLDPAADRGGFDARSTVLRTGGVQSRQPRIVDLPDRPHDGITPALLDPHLLIEISGR